MNVALILSGGTGTRMGTEIPKQYIEIGGWPIISYCVRTLSSHEKIDAIQIVADQMWREQLGVWLQEVDVEEKFRGFSNPGQNRQLSILNGLEDIREYADDADCVLIHDAVRPMLTGKQIEDCLDAAEGHDGVLPVLPMRDTVYVSKDGKKISALLSRDEIYDGQAPEAFHLKPY